jgi:hypothetical protein
MLVRTLKAFLSLGSAKLMTVEIEGKWLVAVQF